MRAAGMHLPEVLVLVELKLDGAGEAQRRRRRVVVEFAQRLLGSSAAPKLLVLLRARGVVQRGAACGGGRRARGSATAGGLRARAQRGCARTLLPQLSPCPLAVVSSTCCAPHEICGGGAHGRGCACEAGERERGGGGGGGGGGGVRGEEGKRRRKPSQRGRSAGAPAAPNRHRREVAPRVRASCQTRGVHASQAAARRLPPTRRRARQPRARP